MSLSGLLEHVPSTWAPAMWRGCSQGTVALLVVYLLLRLLPRLRPTVRITLWRLGHLKLLLAVVWATPVVLPLLPQPVAATLPLPRPHRTGTDAVSSAARAPSAPSATGTLVEPSAPAKQAVTAVKADPAAGSNGLHLLLGMWLMGLAGYGALVLRGLAKARRLRNRCVSLDEPEIEALYAELCGRMGVRHPPELLESEGQTSPVLVGLLRPAIVLPAVVVRECSLAELRLVLAHELAHLRRGDHRWLWLPVATRGLFFFHPLVWVAEREWRDAQEEDCDSETMRALGTDASEYGSVLLKVAALCRRPRTGVVPVLGISESFRTLQRRLIAMDTARRSASRAWTVAGGVLVGIALTALVPWQLGPRPASAAAAPDLTSLTAPATTALKPTPLFDFEKDGEGWFSRIPGSAITVTHNSENVKVGKGALEWSYNPNLANVMLARMQPELPAQAETLDFWMRTSAPGAYQLYFVEGDGSVYHMHMRTTGTSWQHYQVPLSDLVQGEREDSNGRLDLDQVTEITLQDLSRYHSGGKPLQGKRLWLDGLKFTQEQVPARRQVRVAGGVRELLVDDFEQPTLTWAGNINAKLALAETDGRKVLHARYTQGDQAPDRFQISNHFDARYSHAKALKVVAMAPRPTTLTVTLREFDGTFTGPEYAATCQIGGPGKGWETCVLPLSEFHPIIAGSRRRPVDLKRVWLMLVADVTETTAPTQGSLEIDSIAAQLTE